VTFSLNGVSTVVPACPPAPVITPAPAAAPVPAGTSTPGPSAVSVPFSRLGAGGGFPNNDSGYLAAVLTPPTNGDVLVIHAKAPTATQGNDPVPWPTRGIDMRYWSLCGYLASTGDPEVANLLPNGRVDYGCRNNSQTQIDRQGYYTWVVGTEAQRAQIDRIPDATFVPFSSSKPTAAHIFLVRNMLVNPSFGQSILGVPGGSSAATAQQDMGAYYPVAALCPPSSLHGHSGIATCLADASAPA
jgi:hypothetical protein